MTMLLNQAITAAVSAQTGSILQLRGVGTARMFPVNMTLQGTFTYGSGGITASAWVQTSLDGGSTWTDVANFSFTTASARFIFNISSLTPVTTEYTPTDGSLSANTAKDGVFGNLWRVKYTTTGTYVGTSLRVDAISDGLTAQ